MGRPKGVKNGQGKPRREGDIEIASSNPDGSTKPSVYFVGDATSWWLHHLEGIEGYHKPLSDKVTDNTTSKKPRSIYLNHGYFKLKPTFTVMVNEGTTEPMPKLRNGFFCGLYQAYDVQNKIPCVIWCYTAPKDLNTWERLQQQIEYAITRMQMAGVAELDADGYLPAIFKIGKVPTKMGAKFAKVVSWDTSVSPIDKTTFTTLDSPAVNEIYQTYPPMFANEFENRNGPVVVESLPDSIPDEQG